MPLCILLYKTAKTLRELVKAELFSPQKISLNHLKIALYILILVVPYKPNIPLIHSILSCKLFVYICKFLYLYTIILADIYA